MRIREHLRQRAERLEQRLVFDSSLGFVVVSYPVAPSPWGVTSAELNGDGHVDLAVASVSGVVSIFANRGDGTFVESGTYEIGDRNAVTAADFDRDGDIDLAVSSGTAEPELLILLNAGDATFPERRVSSAAPHLGEVAAGDFNGDGALDLAFSTRDGIALCLNDGAAHFSSPVWHGMDLRIGDIQSSDLNEDGLADLIVTDFGGFSEGFGSTASVLLSQSDGGFAVSRYRTGGPPAGVAVADFNDDGWSDFAVAVHADEPTHAFALFLNRRDGTFVEHSEHGLGAVWLIASGDVTGDGLPDVVLLDGQLRLYSNTGSSFRHIVSIPSADQSLGLTVMDLNSDGRSDIVSTDYASRTLTTYLSSALDTVGTPHGDIIRVTSSHRDIGAVIVSINGIAGAPFIPTAPIEIHGLAGDDTITVDLDVAFPVILYGDEGNDTLAGGAGGDLIYGGDGHDVITGGNGNDTLYGNFGSDTMMAGVGDDEVFGGIGRDVVTGGAGDDTLLGGNGTDEIRGGDGNDRLEGKGKADTLSGGDGNDTIISGAGADLIDGGDGDDFLDANPHALFRDTLLGGEGRDRYAADEDDLIEGVEEQLLG